ncbi:hypothetical protein TEA_008678 [Camellia sinensis var. sinensis]|uniref:Protein FMP32, mitochondrial-like n=1 Tax=Camellia sinensis var. sinensis TaxID=542762 RepID=A0A4S4E1Z3_CAMSN|nr:hypothetical protein TEA_008678 [Camellia sinensis var. sinensis]
MAACKRLVQLGPSSGISFTKFRRFSSSEKQFDGSSMIFGSSSSSNSSFNRFDFRQISQLVKPNGKRTEKLRSDIEKMRSELRYEIDKVTAGQRLDLNLERGRIRDELANQNAETTNLTNKLDREIHALRAQLEAAKYDVIKYCIGTLVSISTVGLAVIRILL